MPVDKSFYEDKRLRGGPVGDVVRRRANMAVDSGEVTTNWKTLPHAVKTAIEGRAALFEGQLPRDEYDRARYLETQQQAITRRAIEIEPKRKGAAGQGEQPGSGEGDGKAPEKSSEKGSQDASQGGEKQAGQQTSTSDPTMFPQGDPSRGLSRKAQLEQAAEVRNVTGEDTEPVVRVGDVTGFFDSGMRLPEGAPKWMKETWDTMMLPIEDFLGFEAQVAGGAVEGVQNAAHTFDLAYHAMKRGITGLDEAEQVYFDWINSPDYDPAAQSPFGVVVERPGSVPGALGRTLGQFLPLFLGVNAALTKAGMSGGAGMAVSRDLIAGGVADMAVFDAMEGNLHTLAREMGVENEWTAFMDASTAGSHLEGKLKNSIEGALLTSGISFAFHGGRGVIKSGKMAKSQAEALADAVVRTSRATREMRRARWKAQEEDAMERLEKAHRERGGTLSANPVPSGGELAALSRLAGSKIAQGGIKFEDWLEEWGSKRGYGVHAATKAWDNGKRYLDEFEGRTYPFYSRLIRESLTLQPKGTPEQYRKALKNSQEVSDEELKWSGLDDWLEERERLDEEVTRGDILNFLEDNRVKVEPKVYQRLKGEERSGIAAMQDPYGVRDMEPARVEMEPALSEDLPENPEFEQYIKERLRRHEENARLPSHLEMESERIREARLKAERDLRERVTEGGGELPMTMVRPRMISDIDHWLRRGGEMENRPSWLDEDVADEALDMVEQRFNRSITEYPDFSDTQKHVIANDIATSANHIVRGRATQKIRQQIEEVEAGDREARIKEELDALEKDLREINDPEQFGVRVVFPPKSGNGIVIRQRGAREDFFILKRRDWNSFMEAYKAGEMSERAWDRLHAQQGAMPEDFEDAVYRLYQLEAHHGNIDAPAAPKFDAYQMDPNAETYEEVVYTWSQDPRRATILRRMSEGDRQTTKEGKAEAHGLLKEAEQRYGRDPRESVQPKHFEKKDQIAHARATVDSIDPMNPKVRYNIEEFQSDWFQRKLRDPAEESRLRRRLDELNDYQRKAVDALRRTADEVKEDIEASVSSPELLMEDPGGVRLSYPFDEDAAMMEGWRGAASDIGRARRLADDDPGERDKILQNGVSEFLDSYYMNLLEEVRNGETLPPPDGFPRHNEAWEEIAVKMRRLWDSVNSAANRFPEMGAHLREVSEIRDQMRRIERRRPPGPMSKNWHEMLARQALWRAVNVYDADMVTVVPSQWQSYMWGSNEVAWQQMDEGAAVAFMPRHRVMPHQRNDTGEAMVRLLGEGVDRKGAQIDGAGLSITPEDAGSIDRDRVAHTKIVRSRDDLKTIVGRIGIADDAETSEDADEIIEAWTDRIWQQMQEADQGFVEPLNAGRSVNYDKKYPSALEKIIKKLASAEDKKAVKREVTRRQWADIKNKRVEEYEDGKFEWEIRLESRVQGEDYIRHIYSDSAQWEDVEQEALEFATVPVVTYRIPDSVKQSAKGGVPLMQFFGAGVGAGAVMGGDDGGQ